MYFEMQFSHYFPFIAIQFAGSVGELHPGWGDTHHLIPILTTITGGGKVSEDTDCVTVIADNCGKLTGPGAGGGQW